ncbi:hypothetical protein [Sphingomonas sp. 22176]|uniref:hypothetical protein n=1 Tax=Sphingomonas sp. 22176 TaxID=3453884 RepID=UPI003F853ABC
MELLRHVGRGDAVTLVQVSQMLTIQHAADILNVSRPFFISLLEKGEIAFENVDRHRRKMHCSAHPASKQFTEKQGFVSNLRSKQRRLQRS